MLLIRGLGRNKSSKVGHSHCTRYIILTDVHQSLMAISMACASRTMARSCTLVSARAWELLLPCWMLTLIFLKLTQRAFTCMIWSWRSRCLRAVCSTSTPTCTWNHSSTGNSINCRVKCNENSITELCYECCIAHVFVLNCTIFITIYLRLRGRYNWLQRVSNALIIVFCTSWKNVSLILRWIGDLKS